MIRFFHHYIPVSVLLLVAAEALLFIVSIQLGVSTRFMPIANDIPGSVEPVLPKAVVFAIVMLAVMLLFGLYDLREWEGGLKGMLLRLAASFAIGFILMSVIFYLFPDLFLGRGAFAFAFVFAAAGITIARLLLFRWTQMDMLKPRVLVLGTGSRAAKIEGQLKTNLGGQMVQIVGYLPLNGTHHYVDHSKILPDREALPQLVDKYRIQEIIIAIRDRRGGALPLDELLECRLMGVQIVELSTFLERQTGQLQLESLNASWMILSEGFKGGLGRDAVKRLFDLIVSAILLLGTLPVMALAAVAIAIESGFPILYRQQRVGQDGRTFTIYKFRSMRVDAEKDGRPMWARQNDDRTTRVGRFIRKTRIDELPQIVNVFRGDMSFVGPRPERPFFVEKLATEIPYYACRHSVKPGITGWAQVRASYGASVEDALEKLQYDLYYVKNHSLFLDLLILFQTAQVVVWGKGAR